MLVDPVQMFRAPPRLRAPCPQVSTLQPAASRRQSVGVVPTTRRIKNARMLGLTGFLTTLVGFAVPPLLLPPLPCGLPGLVMLLLNIKSYGRSNFLPR